MPNLIGQTVSHYRILEQLGAGGMGVVYKAEDSRLKRIVALKFLPPSLTSNPDAKERFSHEAQAASALDHPNICNIHEIAETVDGQMFIAMACYDGETLKRKIERGPLPIDQAVSIVTQAAQGLAKTHESGIVHRDIKPANIIVTKDGTAKILDFGLAKLSGRTLLTKTGTTMGTAAYMSPEQARSEEVDKRTDIWSLGVVFYEMLTGKRPYESDYEQALVYSILNEDPRPMRELRPDVPEALEKICRRAMAKDPRDRYQTIADLLTDLESYKAGAQLSHQTRKIVGKNRRLTYAGLAVVVVAIAVIGIFYTTGGGEVFDRVAVLPFHNLSKDSTQEYLADGMTEEVIARLQHVASLNVPSIRGTMRFKGSQASYADIARELHAKALVDASILSVGKRVRIIAKLIDPATDRSLWSETYDGAMDDILDLQSKIAQALVGAVRVEVTHDEATRLSRSRKVDPKAYELYLKARQTFFNWWVDEREFESAFGCLHQAIAIDSSYPAFYSLTVRMYEGGMARGYYSANEVFPLMQQAAETALTLDDQDSNTHLALATVCLAKYDWKGSEAAFLRALDISPGDAEIQLLYSWVLICLDRSEEGIARWSRALEIDPSLDAHGTYRVNGYWYLGRYAEAIQVGTSFLRRFPEDPLLHATLSMSYATKGFCDSAVFHMERSVALESADGDAWIELTCAANYGICGQRPKAMELLINYLAKHKGKTIDPYSVAGVYAILDDTNNAYSWLERAYREKSQPLDMLKVDHLWESQQSNPRYRDMLRRVGLDR